MLTEFMLTSPAINEPLPAPLSTESSKTNSTTTTDGYTWTTVELHEDGIEVYESQFHQFMRSQLLRPESVPVWVSDWSENSVGFIEYHITFMTHMVLSKEPLPAFFEVTNKKTAEVDSTSRKVRTPPCDIVQATVVRRFSEFAALWTQLKAMRVRVPKLPEKQWLPKFNNRWKKNDFLNSRKELLNAWLVQLVHASSSMDPLAVRAIHVFLTPSFPKRKAARVSVW